LPNTEFNFSYTVTSNKDNTMVKKVQKASPAKKPAAPSAAHVKDSAQQIWAAGLAAFTKAQNEGGKVYETLVKEGLAIQRKTQAAAEEKISEATNRMASMATDITTRATGRWDKLENIFEDRVARALNKLGVPSAKDIEALIARIDDLNQSVQQLSAKPATKPQAKPVAGAAAVKKVAPAKKAAPVKAAPAKAAAPRAAKKAVKAEAAPAPAAE